MHTSTNRVSSVVFLLLLLLMLLPAAHAHGVQWRFVGPGASWHASNDGAAVVAPAHPGEMRCENSVDHLNLPVVDCVPEIQPARRAWSEINPAIGLERVSRSDAREGATRDFVQIVRDSYGKWGLMAGRGFTWLIAKGETWSMEAGMAGGLWYRTTAVPSFQQETAWRTRVDRTGHFAIKNFEYTVEQTELERRFVPFAFPIVSIEHIASGAGISVGLMPRTRINGRVLVPTTTLIFQASFRFS